MAEERIEKSVMLCRSGKQIYHKSEIKRGWSAIEGNPPMQDKEWYVEYRPAGVVAKAAPKCKGIPLCLEHPKSGLLDDDKSYHKETQGCVGSDIEVVSLEDENDKDLIGIKADLYFYTDEIYNYYKDNREVSLGYTTRKRWADNPEACGYDIILEEITSVNHVALTKKGRGGEKVAVMDSENKEKEEEGKKSEEQKDETCPKCEHEKGSEACEKECKDSESGKKDEKPCEDSEKEDKDKPCDDSGKKDDKACDTAFQDSIRDIVDKAVKDSLKGMSGDVVDAVKKALGVCGDRSNADSGVLIDSISNDSISESLYDSDALRSFLG